ncbi:ATP-dependent DNA helicase PIF1 [Coprinopsis cinerea okayama7|uniref:ATP-dependent DNA helicase n=1 Tax=Coprinopsis cinerea (strain Okayama-7 / 130 / ATCC MYA-4618 / FGSC 9003) TaxID=240176 RepID=A8P9M3_COPC7|nr:ATP-dependent DNA helicase PIF1 [Coprinopsis cinerea okayama7\|eukprot:XP_001839800.2 ATP-dependent DNA helicase PIF1 [Coprinopsis cinerea okayama7\
MDQDRTGDVPQDPDLHAAILEICASCYKKDLVDLLRTRWAVSRREVTKMQDIVQLMTLASVEDRVWFISASQHLPRKQRRRVGPPSVVANLEGASTPRLADGSDPEHVFEHFSQSELQTLVSRFMPTGHHIRWSRSRLISAVCKVPQNLQRLILRAAARLRPQRQSMDSRSDTPPIEVPHANLHSSEHVSWTDTAYLKPPSVEVIKSCTKAFIERTNNDALAMTACTVCAREVFLNESQAVKVEDIPHRQRLKPATPHEAHQLTDGILLHPRTYDLTDEVRICFECLRCLEKDRTPKLSLANNMWIGDVPRELKGLTLPERILIGLYVPVAHVVKLYPKKVGSSQWNRDMLYDGLRGNVSSFPLDQRLVADMLTGVKPAPLELLSATIGIMFVGPKNVPVGWLHGRLPTNFVVRRHKVAKALEWLIRNNPLYGGVQVSQERLAALPENAIPDQLYAITRISDDTEGLHSEGMNYVPQHDDDPGGDAPEGAAGDEAMDEDPIMGVDEWEDDVELQERPPEIIPITPLGVVDANGENIPERELLAHALANSVRHPGGKDNYFVKYGTAFVNEYARKDPATGQRFDGGPENPSHLLGAFPTLFPYGRGGFETNRPQDVSYEQHSAWALQYSDKRFRKDSHFVFQIFGVRQKRQLVKRKQHVDLRQTPQTAGPDSKRRATNIAGDPYASAKYFHFIVQAVLETLLGIEVSKSHPPRRKEGIFGIVQAYVGTVESQGRGTLHLHILIWLKDAPTPSRLRDLLQSEDFRQRVRDYVDACINADISGKTSAEVDAMPVDRELSYSRPVDTNLPHDEWAETRQEKVSQLARALQFHKCGPTRCLKKIRGVFQCKRRAPWVRSEETWVSTTGEYGPKRIAGFLNSWNDTLMDTLRCNHDLKLLLAIAAIAKIVWYITNYATKKQQRSTNMMAVLADRLAFHNEQEKHRLDAANRNKRLLERCSNALTRDREFSAPEVVSYIMGWGDRYESHTYVPIFWEPAERLLKAAFASAANPTGEEESDPASNRTPLSFSTGKVELQDQLNDYRYRGEALEHYSLFDFILGTYEESIPASRARQAADDLQPDDGSDDDSDPPHDIDLPEETTGARPGRPCNTRVPYLPDAKKPKKWRVVRSRGHETLPRFVGRWPPPNDEPAKRPLYTASMLLLFRPWRDVDGLVGGYDSLEEAFQSFLASCSERDRTVMENIQFYHKSARDARQDALQALGDQSHFAEGWGEGDAPRSQQEREREQAALQELFEEVTEDHIVAAERSHLPEREVRYAENAIKIARNAGILPSSDEPRVNLPRLEDAPDRASDVQVELLSAWKTMLETATRDGNSGDVVEPNPVSNSDGWIGAHAPTPRTTSIQGQVGGTERGHLLALLNEEQRRAHDIIINHLVNHLNGVPQPQLLMQIQGEGGTGKSLLIGAITESFERHQATSLLAKAATTGIASIPIQGQTLHSWASLPIGIPEGERWIVKTNPAQEEERNQRVGTKSYLIVDEVSMMTKAQLQALNRVATYARGKMDNGDHTQPFGGMNVILCGDFHQFPPVSNTSGALYCDRPSTDKEEAKLGRQLFKMFTTVVILHRQNRSGDQRWNELLSRLREGLCSDEDIDVLRGLLVDSEPYEQRVWHQHEWSEPVLVTPRNPVREAWNAEALNRHARDTNRIVFIAPSDDYDPATGMQATPAVQLAIASHKPTKGRTTDQKKLILERKLELVEGTTGSGYKFSIIRRQYALTAAYAFTDYKSQAQTIEKVIVDLEKPPTGHLSPFNVYVALSRSRGRQHIRMLRGFDESLVTVHPSEDLRIEMQRLRALDQYTAQWWASRSNE